MNFKNTLNLPKTDFSMKANLTSLEPTILARWEKLALYQRLSKERHGKEKFILHDGPPYANGMIHTGHALNKILKDIVLKFKLLQGYDVPYVAGWDCHGLPVEHQLFKELKLTKHDVNIVDFRKKAKEFALKFVEIQKQDFKRLGILGDWDNPYLTVNTEYEYFVIKLLEKLTEQGYIYRGRKPVNWCSSCETALAEAEVEYIDKESDSIYVLFQVYDSFSKLPQGNIDFLVWTTTPWTLISNVAVAVHPGLDYCVVQLENRHLIVAKNLIPILEKKLEKKLNICETVRGEKLETVVLRHPFLDRNVPVVLADFISCEEGSGCVHIAPGHGEEDFSLTKKYQLPIIMPVNEKGVFDEPVVYKGKNILEATSSILVTLKENQRLIKHEKITHSYPHCWRCKKPIIFRATFQWFMSIDHNGLRQKILNQIDTIGWVPQTGKERMRSMLRERPDWCLSRQRLWGIPIPAVKCERCNEVILDKKIIAQTAQFFRDKGSDTWFTLPISDFLPKGFCCPKCNETSFVKEFDILDVWFESGASFFAVVKNNPQLQFPADIYLEGSDQHRGWFQVSLIPSVALENVSPFKTLLTHGFVVDGDGRKMSKSLGNVISPQEIIQAYGAEILRLWSAYSDYSEDIKISETILSQLVDMYRKIRNTIRFIMGNLYDFNDHADIPLYQDLLELDRYILSKTMLLHDAVIADYEKYSFYKVCQKIFDFCNLDLSSFYLDIIKDRLYTFSPNSSERRSSQFALYYILHVLLKLVAPILSFTAEEAYGTWNNIKDKKESLFLVDDLAGYNSSWIDITLMDRWEKIKMLRMDVLKEIEKKRGENIIGSSLEAKVSLTCLEPDYAFYLRHKDIVTEVCIVSEVTITQGSYKIVVEKSDGEKCVRCWNWRKELVNTTEYPGVCKRCYEALKGGNYG